MHVDASGLLAGGNLAEIPLREREAPVSWSMSPASASDALRGVVVALEERPHVVDVRGA